MKACLPTNQCTVPENTKLLQDKYGECKAKGEKCKKCGKIGHFAKVCRSKCINNNQYRSNNKSARFSGTRKVHMVTDDGET